MQSVDKLLNITSLRRKARKLQSISVFAICITQENIIKTGKKKKNLKIIMKKTEINNYEDKEQRLFKLKQTRKERKKKNRNFKH